MKLSCTQENLNRGLSIVGRTVSSDNALPVLSNVLLRAEKGRLQLSATDLEIGVVCVIGCRIDEDGAITVPARLLTEYVSSLPEGTIEIELKKQDLHLSLGEYKATIKGVDAEEFPLIPKIAEEPVMEIEAPQLRDAIGKVVFATTADESRPEIAGVFMREKDGALYVVATDSYRLAEKRVDGVAMLKKAHDIIIPAKTLQEVYRILDGVTEKVRISLSENQILFTTTEIELISRLIEGQYPDYEQIMPRKHETEITLDGREFLKTIKITSLFSRSGANDIKFEFDPETDEMVLLAVSDQVGENISRFKVKTTGSKGSIVFNYRYLIDGINNMRGGAIVLEVGADNAPTLMKVAGTDDYRYIIMPIKQ